MAWNEGLTLRVEVFAPIATRERVLQVVRWPTWKGLARELTVSV